MQNALERRDRTGKSVQGCCSPLHSNEGHRKWEGRSRWEKLREKSRRRKLTGHESKKSGRAPSTFLRYLVSPDINTPRQLRQLMLKD